MTSKRPFWCSHGIPLQWEMSYFLEQFSVVWKCQYGDCVETLYAIIIDCLAVEFPVIEEILKGRRTAEAYVLIRLSNTFILSYFSKRRNNLRKKCSPRYKQYLACGDFSLYLLHFLGANITNYIVFRKRKRLHFSSSSNACFR